MTEYNQTTLEADAVEVLRGVPEPIRQIFADGRLSTIIKNIAIKNSLRVDQGAILEKETILLLLGMKDPEQFTQALLKNANLEKDIVDAIVSDINESLFVPIQQKMREGSNIRPATPQTSVPRYETPQSVPRVATPFPQRVPTPPQPYAQPAPRPYTPPPPMPQATPMPRPMPQVPANLPGVMTSDRLLEDHEEPHIEMPEALGARDLGIRQIPNPPPLKPSAQNLTPVSKPIATYSTDPYREQFDDK
jgi:hypothetical protein